MVLNDKNTTFFAREYKGEKKTKKIRKNKIDENKHQHENEKKIIS